MYGIYLDYNAKAIRVEGPSVKNVVGIYIYIYIYIFFFLLFFFSFQMLNGKNDVVFY